MCLISVAHETFPRGYQRGKPYMSKYEFLIFTIKPSLSSVFPNSVNDNSTLPVALAKISECHLRHLSFFHSPHPICQQIPSALSSSISTSHHLHCYQPGSGYCKPFPGLLQQPTANRSRWSCFPAWSVFSAGQGPLKTVSGDIPLFCSKPLKG